MDRKRKKKSSNEDWKSPSDEEAEITKLGSAREFVKLVKWRPL
jgi:hypothetical protein